MDGVIATASKVRLGELSASEVVEQCKRNTKHRNELVNAFSYLDWEHARRSAELIDQKIQHGDDPGLLAGVPFGVKDIENCAGMPTRFGSVALLAAPPASHDDPDVARLRGAGAIPIGKTTTPEFAFDSITSTPGFGTTRNPWDLSKTPGGSSGGSAAAVAAGIVPFATGTDEGGSVRSPAAFCGLVGLKPTHGFVPRAEGVSDTNVVSVLAHSGEEVARLLDVIAGRDDVDKMSQTIEPVRGLEEALRRGVPPHLRARWSPDLGYAPVEREVAGIAGDAAVSLCEAIRCHLSDEQVAFTNANEAWMPIVSHRLRAQLEHMGIWPERSGEMSDTPREWLEEYGTPSAREYGRALALRAAVEAELATFFSDCDLLMTPTVACAAFSAVGPIPAIIDGRDASATGAEAFTMLANLAWVPAISIPAGRTSAGLPVGLQVVGKRWTDGLLLQLAHTLHGIRPWPLEAPLIEDTL